MVFFKESKLLNPTKNVDSDNKEFITDMSYRVRDPLNSICGIAEILTKCIENDSDKEHILSYMDILKESAKELQVVIDSCFSKYESIPEVTYDKKNIDENDYDILKNLRVLVAEDSEVNQLIVKELLESKGAIVTICNNGKEVYDKFKNSITGTYDVILMDIKMPVMDGYEATDKIRNSGHTQARSIPIIAVTGEVFAEDIQMALNTGMDAHVSKPFSLAKMVIAIQGVKQ